MTAAALFIDGLEFFPGSTRDQFKAMAAALSARGYAPFFGKWNDPPAGTIFDGYDKILIVGHSYGGHEAIKLCGRLTSRMVGGLVILDAVNQDVPWPLQFSADPFPIPPNVVQPLSIKRTPITYPFSQGFDETGFNRLREIDHGAFPRDPEVIRQVDEWVGLKLAA